MDVSIIIVNYNTLEVTQGCINSVFEHTKGLDFEIVLVDNASTDGSKEHFEQDKRITYIYSSENLGFGRANNLGYEFSRGEYVFLLNSDTYLLNNAIFSLWNAFTSEVEKINNIACAGTILLDACGKITHSYARFPSMIESILGGAIYPILYKTHLLPMGSKSTSNYRHENTIVGSPFDVDYITGADLMIKRDVIKKHGLFDPDFFMYYEETEMQYRYMRAGLRRVMVTGPQIVHLEGKSNRSTSPQKATMVMRSLFLFFRKTRPPFEYFIFSVLYKICYLSTHILGFPFMPGEAREKMIHLCNVFKM